MKPPATCARLVDGRHHAARIRRALPTRHQAAQRHPNPPYPQDQPRQPSVFARYINASVSPVQKCETGAKQPSESSLRLLHLVKNQGLEFLL